MDKYQDKLSDMVAYAYHHTAFYRDLYAKAGVRPNAENMAAIFSSLPIVTKKNVLDRSADFLSDEYDKTELLHDRTSGSTGKILDIYWNKKQHIRSLMSLWSRRHQRFGIMPDSKCVFFHSIAYRENSGFDDEGNDVSEAARQVFSPHIMLRENGIVLSLSKLDFSERALNTYYRYIVQFEPEWMMGHPSTVLLLARHMQSHGLPPIKSLKYIELAGEFLQPAYRTAIEEIMQVPTANEYGAREVNGIAFECAEGHLHVMPRNVHVEIIEDGVPVPMGEPGHVCITGLNNKAMPFVRYDLGDRGRLLPGESCSCGNVHPILDVQAGRGNELITRPDGTYVECVIMFYAVEAVNAYLDQCILQFRAIQKDVSNFELQIVVPADRQSNELDRQIRACFLEALRPYGFGDTHWTFTYWKEITPDTETGKLNFFINRMVSL